MAYADNSRFCIDLNRVFGHHEEEIPQFLRAQLKGPLSTSAHASHGVVFCVDQFNALDHRPAEDPLLKTRKEEARDMLRVVMYDTVVISSSSADHYISRFSLTALRNELQYLVTRGMNACEMDGWFRVYSETLPGNHDKDEIFSLR